jgi:arylsulfatase A-like enzyme
MPRPVFRTTVTSLWFRLITLGILGLVFAEALRLAQGEAQGWTYYLTTGEVIFEVVVRFVFAALAGIVAGTLCTVMVAPFLWRFEASRQRIAAWTIKVVLILVVFFDSRYALITLLHSWRADSNPSFTHALLTAHFLIFAAVLWIPRTRRQVIASMDGVLADQMTRRTAIATVVGAAGLVATEYALSRSATVVKAALAGPRPKSNVLLITFDALAAEDMSCYGYRLPTTPNIDAFARNGTLFKNFYSASTFTTPGIATMLTGLYPSQHKVYQLIGRLQPEDARRSLPHQMRAAGYATGAFISSPYAYYLAHGMRGEYDFLPEPTFQKGGLQHLWDGTASLHQDTGIGNRMDEYNEMMLTWNALGGIPLDLFHRFPAVESFAHGEKMIDKLPDGFFLWIHVMTPHSPYHPDAASRGTFIPDKELRKFEDEGDDGARRWYPVYPPDQQPQVDLRRLAYDEFILTADRAFGSFMSAFEKTGRLRDTTVIISADHGESFEGGVYQHENQYMTRPEIHIPLIVRTPGQQQGRTVSITADQTALAPTILEIAGQPKPYWMPGQSLAPLLSGDSSESDKDAGMAFCQFLETDSIFRPMPLRLGTVGVIEGHYQYVILLSSLQGVLRPLSEAQSWTVDRSADHPEKAMELRQAINSKFPGLLQTSA